jgi:hypothetical protein
MGSRSSRRKNASGPDARTFQRLLQDGVVLDATDPTISAGALQLMELKLVEMAESFSCGVQIGAIPIFRHRSEIVRG